MKRVLIVIIFIMTVLFLSGCGREVELTLVNYKDYLSIKVARPSDYDIREQLKPTDPGYPGMYEPLEYEDKTGDFTVYITFNKDITTSRFTDLTIEIRVVVTYASNIEQITRTITLDKDAGQTFAFEFPDIDYIFNKSLGSCEVLSISGSINIWS